MIQLPGPRSIGLLAIARRFRAVPAAIFILLAIEFTDELTFGLREAAWPLIRADLSLSYAQIGLIFTIPALISAVLEVGVGVLADTGHRAKLVVLGGVLFGASLIVTALLPGFAVLLIATIVLYPASGAFVSVAQAILMDRDPTRREQNMAKWTFSGSVGIVAGSLIVAAGASVGIGWEAMFVGLGALALSVTLAALLAFRGNSYGEAASERTGFRESLAVTARSLRNLRVLRWLGLLRSADLIYDVLVAFLALYFVDVIGASTAQAAIAVTIWSIVGLIGDFAMIPLLERVRGSAYIRISAGLSLAALAGFLTIDGLIPGLFFLGLLGLLSSGWYSVLQAGLYSELPGRSGTVVAIGALSGLLTSALPLGIGLAAGAVGLKAAFWILVASPVLLLVGFPNNTGRTDPLTGSLSLE